MPTYTNLGIKKITTGDESGTWGTSTNTNFDYFDTAIVGYISVTLPATGSSGTPNTLNVADYAASDGRNRVVEFVSASDLGGDAYVQITPATFEGYYFIRNSLSGNRNIYLFQGTYDAARDYVLPNGKDLVVRCSGGGTTSYVYSVLDNPSFSSISASTAALSSTVTLSGLTASTALALDASKNVVSVTNTGTGNNVLATSPTLTTPNLGTPSAATLTNATGLPVSTGISGLGAGVATFLGTPSSANLAAAVTDETGTGALVFATSPALTTPNLGTPSAATLTNATGLPLTTGVTGTLPVANGGTGITSLGSGVATFLGTPSSANLAAAVTDETGTGALVFATSPALTTPNLGTPSAATLTNATGLPVSTGISGLGAGVATFLGTPSSANLAAAVTGETGTGALVFATSPALTTPNLGTPSAATLTNATGLPVSTGISGLGAGVATFLGTPTSANLAAAVTDETGTGALVFATSPALTTPNLGTPSAATLTNATGLPVSTGISGLGTGIATALAVNTGSSGSVVVNGGALGTPSSGTVTNLTGTASININGTVGLTTPKEAVFSRTSTRTTTVSVSGTDATTGTTSRGYDDVMTLSSSVNQNHSSFFSAPTVSATSLSDLYCFFANGCGKATGASVVNQYGFYASQFLFNGATNYGFYSDISSASGYNFYANGPSPNYFSGKIGLGITSPGQKLDIADTNTGLTGTTATNTLRFTDTDTTTAANQPIGKIEFYNSDTDNAAVGAFILASAVGTSGGGTIRFAAAANAGAAAEVCRVTDTSLIMTKDLAGLGYGTGTGGAVTQATSRTTGVTLNKTNGAITLVSAAGSATWQSFTVTNSAVAATDTVVVNQKSGTDLYMMHVTNVAAGSFRISFATTGGTTTEQPVFNFAVIKAVTA